MAIEGIKPYIWGRVFLGFVIACIVWIVLSCTTKINYKLSSTKDIKIEKVESVMVPDNHCNCSKPSDKSFHEEKKVTFTYNHGKGKIIENYDVTSSTDEYFFNKLVEDKKYYVPNGWLIAIMIILGGVGGIGTLIHLIEYESFSRYTSYHRDGWEEIYKFRSGIVKQFMVFCGYNNMDAVIEEVECNNTWSSEYVPKYSEIYTCFKIAHKRLNENT